MDPPCLDVFVCGRMGQGHIAPVKNGSFGRLKWELCQFCGCPKLKLVSSSSNAKSAEVITKCDLSR